MIEVRVESVQVSLISPHRIVLLKALSSDRYLPIWIGPCEAEAISICLQGIETPRPLTHDLLQATIHALQGNVLFITVTELNNDTFYAKITVEHPNGRLEIDSRPSDAIALAVRVHSPIYVSENVMQEAGITPEPAVDVEQDEEDKDEETSAFRDFVESLNLDDLDPSG